MIHTDASAQAIPGMSVIYQNNVAWMVREARAQCRDLAEDVVQDTFFTLLRRGQETELMGMEVPDQVRFLRRCLQNQIHKEWTRSSRVRRGGGVVAWVSLQTTSDPIELPDERQFSRVDMQRATLEEMQEALKQLKASMKPDAWRRVQPFFESDHRCASDLHQRCRLSGALRTALSRARSKLRHILRTYQNT